MFIKAKNSFLKITAYQGDAKTLLAFDVDKAKKKDFAGFTIEVKPPTVASYYILNKLQFETSSDHSQDQSIPANSSLNAPFQKFRWLHVPGSAHQGLTPEYGKYVYSVSPRYFAKGGSLLPIDQKMTLDITVPVGPFSKGSIQLGFTRGFVQSQAFVNHFGKYVPLKPKGSNLVYDTSKVAGKNSKGDSFTYLQEYEWAGFTAREIIFDILDTVVKDKSLTLDIFAYDFSEPDIAAQVLELAKQQRVRIILDNATLHTSTKTKQKPEDQFDKLFRKAWGGKNPSILRCKFGRYAHDKILIVRNKSTLKPIKVLSGSTNFSVTGMYVNSNHVITFKDASVCNLYGKLFDTAWQGNGDLKAFLATPLSQTVFQFPKNNPTTEITFAPHEKTFATKILNGIVQRIKAEKSSVLFAVMDLQTSATGNVYPALRSLHNREEIFSYGITDTPDGISLYKPGTKKGILVTGKPSKDVLPPPFSQVDSVGIGHQVHHKFVVCGFNSDDPTVYFGSSNLALGGESENGDNLICIRDEDIATVFALEALALVDHFQFLNAYQQGGGGTKEQSLYLKSDDSWTDSYYKSDDLHCLDRILFIN